MIDADGNDVDPTPPILVVDDEKHVADGLEAILSEEGYTVEVVGDGEEAWERLQDQRFGLVLVDLKLPEMGGMELFQKIREEELGSEIIIVTGQASVDTAVEAMRRGAYDYLEKPLEMDRLKALVAKALEKYRVRQQNAELERMVANLDKFEGLTGRSEQMKEIYKVIEAVAPTDAPVLIYGESGTGKELVSRALHEKSQRSDGPFVAVNCAAFPKDILENELFGHEKGAFTGSLKEKAGCFELADGGTLFLDEIAEMSPDTQVKLLRAIETQQFRRLGGKDEIHVDNRVVAATNVDVHEARERGDLREDLYYRLAVVEIAMPPLRERGNDVHLLASEFLQRFAEDHDKEIAGFSEEATKFLGAYDWPGNVRELKNAVERAVIMTGSGSIPLEAIRPRAAEVRKNREVRVPIGESLDEARRRMILQTFAAVDGDRGRAADILGLGEEDLAEELHELLKPKGQPAPEAEAEPAPA